MALENKIAITVSDISTDGDYMPISDLEQADFEFVLADDEVTPITFSGFSNRDNGNYEFWDFAVPEFDMFDPDHDNPGNARVRIKINDAIQYGYGIFTVYADEYSLNPGVNDSPVSRSYVDGRVDRIGDTIHGWLTYDGTTNWQGGTVITNPQDYNIVHKKYVADNYMTLATTQTVTGQKTFEGITTFDVGNSSDKFVIRQNTNPPNGGVVAMNVDYQADNKPLIDFNNSKISSDGTADFWHPRVKTTSNYYLNPLSNTLVSKTWVENNFMPYGATYNSNTIIVDAKIVVEVELKMYPSITNALIGLQSAGLAEDNIYTIIIKQHYDNSAGYDEDVELPDWVNIVGDGKVLIKGSFSRASSIETGLTAKLHNLTFVSTGAHNVERVEADGCIFDNVGSANTLTLVKTKALNCGFYSDTVESSGNNKIVGCFGNYDVDWDANDKVYGYNYIIGDTYN